MVTGVSLSQRTGRPLRLDDSTELLAADLRIPYDFKHPRFAAMFWYSITMGVVVCLGFPAALFWALWRHREQVRARAP